MPKETADRLTEAARISGTDRSTYIRDALDGALSLTTEAAGDIAREASRRERVLLAEEVYIVREECARALEEMAALHQRIADLESEHEPHLVRMLLLSVRVLNDSVVAREAFVEAWQALDLAELRDIVPLMYRVVLRESTQIGEKMLLTNEGRAKERRLLENASWLLDRMHQALRLPARPPTSALNDAGSAEFDLWEARLGP